MGGNYHETFFFVRHGQTVWNVENKICRATDGTLTEYDREQAKETGRGGLAEKIKTDEILCSPFSGAADTTKLISEMTGIPYRVEPRLIKQNFGKLESLSGMERILRKQKSSLHVAMKAENPHFAWRRES